MGLGVVASWFMLACIVSADTTALEVGGTEEGLNISPTLTVPKPLPESKPARQLTDIDTATPNAGASDQPQAQQIIATLTQTIGNLSQQLLHKDQQIEHLQKQLVEFTQHGNEDIVVQPITLLPEQQFQSMFDKKSPAIIPIGISSIATQKATSVWQWLLLSAAVSAALACLLRAGFYWRGQSLNLFSSTNKRQFNSTAQQKTDLSGIKIGQESTLGPTRHSSSRDTVSGREIKKNMADEEVMAGISYLDLADEARQSLEFQSNQISDDIEDLNFNQRFDQLLDEKDFQFARELLDFARYNEINDDRYHYERLRLLEKMRDEDGFYKYYYEIESKIPSFPANLQTQISQLVVQLAQA